VKNKNKGTGGTVRPPRDDVEDDQEETDGEQITSVGPDDQSGSAGDGNDEESISSKPGDDNEPSADQSGEQDGDQDSDYSTDNEED